LCIKLNEVNRFDSKRNTKRDKEHFCSETEDIASQTNQRMRASEKLLYVGNYLGTGFPTPQLITQTNSSFK